MRLGADGDIVLGKGEGWLRKGVKEWMEERKVMWKEDKRREDGYGRE